MTETAATSSICTVVGDGSADTVDFHHRSAQDLLDRGEFFWLDLERPMPDDYAVLRDVFRFHPLAVEDSENFGQRAKLDPYDDYVFLVVYGANKDDDRLVEVHCFYAEGFLVTVHRDDCEAFRELRHRYVRRPQDDGLMILYQVVDRLVDSFFPMLEELDDRIDELEDAIFLGATEEQLQEIFQMKRLLVGLRKAVTPERDLLANFRAADLPGGTAEHERYFRDVYDHMIRISDLIDTYRDLLTGSMDVYLSTVSNRMNAVMKQLTVISTIFLPLTFLTGFFGQNFGWMVRHVGGVGAFVGLGLVLEVAFVAVLVGLFKRRGWF